MIFDKTQKAAEASEQTIYTCPMHPEVQSNEPGSCPKCGMFLVSQSDADDNGHGSEHKHEVSEKADGCCGGHSHKAASGGGGCCGGHEHESAHH